MIRLINIIGKFSTIDAFIETEGSNESKIYDSSEYEFFIKRKLIWSSGSTPPGYLGDGLTGEKLFRDLKLKSPKYIKFHLKQLESHKLTIKSLMNKEVKDINIICILEKTRVNTYFRTDARIVNCKIKIFLV